MLDAVFEHIHISCIAFGFIGAALHLYNVEDKEKISARNAIGNLVTGMIMANLLAPQLLKVMSMLPLDLISLGVGATGKHSFLLLEMLFRKLDLLGKTKNE